MFLPLCQWGLLVVKCWNSNITTAGVNYSNLYLSFINFKQTWYVICSSRILSFGWYWLCSCTEENRAFRGEDLEAVDLHVSPFETLCDLQGFAERVKQMTVIAVWNETIWTLNPLFFCRVLYQWNNWNKLCTFYRQQELHTRSDKWDNLFITMATSKHTLMLMWSHDFPHDLKFEAGFLLKFVLICLFRF
jgi:hypothetical protein